MSSLGIISDITIYPIKSFSGIKLDKAIVHKYGLAHPDNPAVMDRKWMVVDENGSFLTQRQLPKMVLIKPRLEGDFLVLSAPGKNDIKVPIKPSKNRKECRVWNLNIDGYVCGNEIGKWISEFLERENLDLVCFDEGIEPRLVFRESGLNRNCDYIIYSDYSPVMLISEASLDDLNSRLENKVSMRNFRPNLSVKGCDAYSEDKWAKFRIGESNQFVKIKECTRCLLTTIDPDKAEKSKDQQPLKTLKEYRQNKPLYGEPPMMGINIVPDTVGSLIKIGDEIIGL